MALATKQNHFDVILNYMCFFWITSVISQVRKGQKSQKGPLRITLWKKRHMRNAPFKVHLFHCTPNWNAQVVRKVQALLPFLVLMALWEKWFTSSKVNKFTFPKSDIKPKKSISQLITPWTLDNWLQPQVKWNWHVCPTSYNLYHCTHQNGYYSNPPTFDKPMFSIMILNACKSV